MNNELKKEYLNNLREEGYVAEKVGKTIIYTKPAVKVSTKKECRIKNQEK